MSGGGASLSPLDLPALPVGEATSLPRWEARLGVRRVKFPSVARPASPHPVRISCPSSPGPPCPVNTPWDLGLLTTGANTPTTLSTLGFPRF